MDSEGNRTKRTKEELKRIGESLIESSIDLWESKSILNMVNLFYSPFSSKEYGDDVKTAGVIFSLII